MSATNKEWRKLILYYLRKARDPSYDPEIRRFFLRSAEENFLDWRNGKWIHRVWWIARKIKALHKELDDNPEADYSFEAEK